jgi:hypothetical protein
MRSAGLAQVCPGTAAHHTHIKARLRAEFEARFCVTQVKWYLKAAQQGHVEAMFSVGMCFESVGLR